MASTFVNNLRLEEMNTGEQSGTWGTKTNTNLELIADALGFGTEAITTNADTHATTIADGASDAGRAIYIIYTGTLDSACTITIGPDTLKRVHIIKNGTSGGQNILIKQGTGGGAAVTIPNGDTKVVSLDGNGSGAIVTDVLASLSVVNLNATGAITSTGRIVTDDTTAASSTTDGSLQTDGGLSVAGDAIIGDDLKLLSDSAILSLGAGSDATLTHDGTTGVTIAANPITIDSGDALNLDAHTGIFVFKDAGSEVLRFTEGNSGDVTIKLATNAKDLVFTDNGDATNMKILDAAAGINVPGEVQTTKIAFTDGDDAMTVADGGSVTFADDVTVTGRATPGTAPSAGSATTGTVTFDLATNNNFHLTTSGNVTDLTFSNHNVAGQTGTIKVVNSGHTIAVNAMVAINADTLTALQTAGSYMLTYLVTATGGGSNTIFISSSGALT
jgi:hypothetical protein